MNNYEIDPLTLSKRMTKARKNHGWSQEKLAEMVDCSAQNIAKFEKNGLTNIDWIGRLSNALGQNLLVEVIDIDAKVSDLGREILFSLVCRDGNIEVSDLITNYMYGLSDEQVSNEIYKIAMCGLVMREPYIDWYSNERDRLFITAKGLITLKNLDLNASQADEVFDMLDSVKTYEMLIQDNDSYQEYIDSQEAEKLIRNIDYNLHDLRNEPDGKILETPFRMNYVKYLKQHYEKAFETDNSLSAYGNWCPAVNCYHDILYRMAYKLTDKAIRERYFGTGLLYDWCDIDVMLGSLTGWDDVVAEATEAFQDEFDCVNEHSLNDLKVMSDFLQEAWSKLAERTGKSLAELRSLMNDETDSNESFVSDLSEEDFYYLQDLFDLNESVDHTVDAIILTPISRPEGKSEIPIDWFTDEEIKTFIEENIKEAETDCEKELEKKLARINELLPESLGYYKFPIEWEKNGIAELIRTKIGIPAISD